MVVLEGTTVMSTEIGSSVEEAAGVSTDVGYPQEQTETTSKHGVWTTTNQTYYLGVGWFTANEGEKVDATP